MSNFLGGVGDALQTFFIVSVFILFPLSLLGIWKLIEIIIWFCSHIAWR